MSNNTTARPFEVGALITGKPKANNGVIDRIDSDGLILYNRGDRFFLTFDDVKKMYIRKPRKGSKEARDIVAKIGWMYLMAKKDADDMDWCVDDIADCQSMRTQSTCLKTAYETAKSMLK